MKAHHWLAVFVTLFVGYMVGIFFPSFGVKLRGTLGM